jgi:hypothetical protein
MKASLDRFRANCQAIGITVVLAMMLAHPVWAAPQAGSDDAPLSGTITGKVIDPLGAPVPGATIALVREGVASPAETVSDADGRFAFTKAAPGAFELTVTTPGFAVAKLSGQLAPGATVSLATIQLMLSAGAVNIDVRPDRVIAEEQLKTQEKQRVFGIFQNFLVSYDPSAVPLDAPQKFRLAWKSVTDPVQYGWIAALVGIQQSRNDFSGFGDDGQGYAKRYMAECVTIWTGTVLTKAALPMVFKQDPRYFYKGTGSTASRTGYALSRALVRRGDDGHLGPDYSRILGHLAAGAISNLYYPPQNRQGVPLTLQYATLAITAGAIDNLLQEFLLKRFTTHAPGSHAEGGGR